MRAKTNGVHVAPSVKLPEQTAQGPVIFLPSMFLPCKCGFEYGWLVSIVREIWIEFQMTGILPAAARMGDPQVGGQRLSDHRSGAESP